MNAMDLSARRAINENIKSVQLLFLVSGCLDLSTSFRTITDIERAPTAALIAPVQLSQRLTDSWWFRSPVPWHVAGYNRGSNWNARG